MSGAAQDDRPDRLEEAGRWCMRLSEGSLTASDRQAFDAWLALDPDNEAAFARAAGVWNALGEAAAEPELIDLRAQALDAFRAANSKRWAANDRRALKWATGIAAMLLLVLLPAGLWYANLPTTYETGTGERQVAMLADGSRLSLDAMSQVKVKLRDDARDITLIEGRAKFDVAKDALRPFRVHVADKIVVATGTSFSVELLNGSAHVVLYEGHVAVVDASEPALPVNASRPKAPSEVDLNPGKELIASLSNEQTKVVPADVDRSLSWEAGQLSFNDEPLASAVTRVNRYSEKKVVIADASIRQLPVSGVYNAGDVEAFKVGIEAVMPVKAVDNGETIAISRR